MVNRFWSVIVLQVSFGYLAHCSQKMPVEDAHDGPGEPLFLTPYIERGEVTEARKLAQVPLFDNLSIESYAGFFTVNKTYDSNHFVWYFPSMSNKTDAPVILWLQGGPGSSGLNSLFMGNGPVAVRNHTFERRKHHWALKHHMIYVDSPVSTGFSFTNHSDGYCTDQTQINEHLYSTTTQFFKLFPELQQNKFFIAGESYGGKYAPGLAYTIHKKNPSAETRINLKGLTIGNGLTDPENQFMYSQYLYQIGLIDINQRNVFEEYEAKYLNHIKNEQWVEAFDTMFDLIIGDDSYFHNFTGFDHFYNFLHPKNYIAPKEAEFQRMLKRYDVRKAMHVGDLEFHSSAYLVQKYLKPDLMKSVAPWVSELLEHYYCLIYSGQVDIIVAYPLTLNYLRKLKFSGAEEYKTAERYIWRVNDEVAGYVKHAGKLVDVLVRNAGHAVPMDQPEWAMDMIQTFTDHAK